MNGTQEHPYSVSGLTGELKAMIEGRFPKIFLEAEISGWKIYPSGHVYFTLKDSAAQISAVMFAGSYQACLAKHPGIGAQLRDGARVLVYGGCSVYPPRGGYQFIVRAMTLVGEGDLMRRYLELKAKLEREGLFDAARKRKLPFLPRRIGIVTSEAGAVIHDMCTVMTRRFPALAIRLHPAQVQGADAPATLIAGLRYFASLTDWRPDLVIIARGGGSFEDLFCFNDEGLVREVAAMPMPVVSAVGHETDVTLCDFAADVRAGTPSIAAELAVPRLEDLESALGDMARRLAVSLRNRGEFLAQRVDHLGNSLAVALRRHGDGARQRVDRLGDLLAGALSLAVSRAEARTGSASARLLPAMRGAHALASARLSAAGDRLSLLSPYGVLDRGYALVTDPAGAVIRDADAVLPGAEIAVRLARGSFRAVRRP